VVDVGMLMLSLRLSLWERREMERGLYRMSDILVEGRTSD